MKEIQDSSSPTAPRNDSFGEFFNRRLDAALSPSSRRRFRANVTNEAKRLLKIKDNVFPRALKAKRYMKTKELFL